MNTVEQTVKNKTCINCGICKFVCKFDAIKMVRNKYGELNPVIDRIKCKKCGKCLNFCPNSKEKMQNEAKKVTSYEQPHTFGLQDANYYIAWNLDKEQRQKCCSGGAVTKLAEYLFKSGKIDGMIHVERLWGKRGDFHYGARISKSIEEIREHVSSAYQPIDFSKVLSSLEKGKTYFMTGTPCVIRGIKELIKCSHDFDGVKIMTCVLVCSHNTNTQVIDFLTEINDLCKKNKEEWKVNIRYKDDSIKDANNFKNYIYTKDSVLLDKNRHESGWTHIWRNYYFAMSTCLKCSDFWGYEADISVKDAWGKWAKDPLGHSIVVIRNKELEKDFLDSGLAIEPLSYEVMKKHQEATPRFKQTEAYNKNFKSVLSRSNRRNGMFKYFLLSNSSKILYKYLGFKLTKMIMPFIEKIAGFGEKL